ncbi:hypothetical protein [Nitritalea halalkaliphila]|uniref:hypothetical protein n=1 Tax=Nitritalea halalkaliphila TaxID=590849 RepID=UPI001389DD2B|nr:hypothetical protein [Nitritalea halalkaliphila]
MGLRVAFFKKKANESKRKQKKCKKKGKESKRKQEKAKKKANEHKKRKKKKANEHGFGSSRGAP